MRKLSSSTRGKTSTAFPAATLLLVLLAQSMMIRADHESAEAIIGAFKRESQRGAHVLLPAKNVRQLPVSADKALVDRVSADARSYLADAFSVVIVENGEIIFEGYAKGAAKDVPLNAYSMAKSLTALAVGEALCAGKLKSLEDKAIAYVPAIDGTSYGAASIRNLLRYTSGAQDPGGDGYSGVHDRDDLRAMVLHQMSMIDLLRKHGQTGRWEQGTKFIYNGLDSQTLGLIVRSGTGMPLQKWFEETVWQKAGAEFPAAWRVDRDGNGIAEAAMHATTRDFARVGLYILERLTGKADDRCLTDFIRDAAAVHTHKGYWNSAPAFGMGLHVGADGNTWMFGHAGQRVGISVKTGRVFATNGFKEWRGFDNEAQALLAR